MLNTTLKALISPAERGHFWFEQRTLFQGILRNISWNWWPHSHCPIPSGPHNCPVKRGYYLYVRWEYWDQEFSALPKDTHIGILRLRSGLDNMNLQLCPSSALQCRSHLLKMIIGFFWLTKYMYFFLGGVDTENCAGRNKSHTWYQSNGRKWRGIQDLLGESERGEWKSWFKTQHLKN